MNALASMPNFWECLICIGPREGGGGIGGVSFDEESGECTVK